MSKELVEWAKNYFGGDIYATDTTGIIINEVEQDYAKCTLPITPKILNAGGKVMGGAIFTLADYTFAIAANTCGINTVSLNAQINYIKPPQGETITAETACIKSKGKTCIYSVSIYDETGTVAVVTSTGFRVSK